MKEDNYYKFLKSINEIFIKGKESELERQEIDRRIKVLIYLFKNKEYNLIETMIKYYMALEILQYAKITKN